MPDNGTKGPPEQENYEMEDMMSPFMMMQMIFKLKEKVAKLDGMMKVMMHTQGGGGMHQCSCNCCHH